jgi:hypothetical protein
MMRDLFITNCNNTISEVQELLNRNPEWSNRYEKYAKKIHAKQDTIKNNKKKFHEWAPLYLYMNVSEAKGKLIISLRFSGQDVAKLYIRKDKIIISTKKFDSNNLRDFGCNVILDDCEWRSQEAKNFRNHFSSYFERTKKSGKGNEEHRIENLLLTEFSKKSSGDKKLCKIQPVKLAGIYRFQMPTPLSASNINKLKYSGSQGGGIDILARSGTANGIKLCIIEVKDEYKPNEPPTKVIQQALAYATFIQQLLRSKSGKEWWKLFGFNRKLPKHIQINVVCAMPTTTDNDTSFSNQIIKIDNDSFQLHYIYFQEKNNEIKDILTSLSECKK